MEKDYGLGQVNGHVVGRVLKEAMRRATVTIRNERLIFEATAKEGYDGSGAMNDVFTSADTKAQAIYLRTFEECFPNAGVIGEEASLRIEPKNGCKAYFTVDPLDGTRAYVRRQSDGVGTMVALAEGSKVLSAYIGDINTEEVYGYRPGSSKVFRITRLDTFEELSFNPEIKIADSYALLRDPVDTYSAATRNLLKAFKNHQVIGSSIGIWAARLWKQEVAALILPPGVETPWDSTPVIGISRKLGYAFFESVGGTHWHRCWPRISDQTYRRDHELLIVHESLVPQLTDAWPR